MVETPQSLLERLRRRPDDAASWQRLVDLYTPFLRHWLRHLQASDADDVVQNILTVLVRKLPEFQHIHQAGAFRAWLKAILRNCLHEHHRGQMPEAEQQTLDNLIDPASDLSRRFDEEHHAQLIRRLAELAQKAFPRGTWLLFQDYVLLGKEVEEVAKDHNVSVNVVYLARSRILKWLRDEGRGLIDDE